MESPLSPGQVRSRVILICRRVVAQHWPGADGVCPVCAVADCRLLAAAVAYLDRVDEQSRQILAILPGAERPTGDALADLRATVDRLAAELAPARPDWRDNRRPHRYGTDVGRTWRI